MTRRCLVTAVAVLATTAIAVGATPASAESTAATVAAGTGPVAVVVDGVPRDALVHVPASVAARPGRAVPLVLHLHGGLGSPEHSIATTDLVSAADEHGFLVAFPRGTEVGVRLPNGAPGYAWNAGRCCESASRDGVDDVRFLADLVSALSASLPVDEDRVVMSGHSNGAMMAWRFACEQPGVLAAAMPVAGSLEMADPSACTPDGTSLLAVHGDADRNHPIAGGRGERSVAGVDFRPFGDSMAAYARTAGCARRPTTVRREVSTETRYRRCARDARVRSVVLHGADHPWPGGAATGTALQGEPFAAWSATDALVGLLETLDPPTG